MKESTVPRVRALVNDALRKEREIYTTLTRGIQAIEENHGPEALEGLIREVAEFDAFTEDNDPWGEHDFGSFDYMGSKIFWKIDYYTPELWKQGGVGTYPIAGRVMTVMLAEEY